MPLDQKTIDRETRLVAIEYMLSHTYNLVLRLTGASEAAIQQSESDGKTALARNTFAGLDPAMSDHMSAETLEAIERLWSMAKEMRDLR